MDVVSLMIVLSSVVCLVLGAAGGFAVGYGRGVADALRRRAVQ